EVVPVESEELRMVERVVEERRELEPEVPPRDDVLVEREVDHPGSGTPETTLLGVPVLPLPRQCVGAEIDAVIARAAGVGGLELVGAPAVREAVAEAVESVGGVPGAGRVVAAKPGGEVVPAPGLEDRGDRPAPEERVRPARHVGAVRAVAAD